MSHQNRFKVPQKQIPPDKNPLTYEGEFKISSPNEECLKRFKFRSDTVVDNLNEEQILQETSKIAGTTMY